MAGSLAKSREHFATAEDIRQTRVALSDPAVRLRFAIERVRGCAELRQPHKTSRAILLAGHVLGLDYVLAERLFRDLGAGCELPEWAIAVVGALRPKRVGHVYFAEPEDGAGVIKVGFSSDPRKRLEQVSRFYGVRFGIVGSLTGTMLCEHWYHCRWQKHHIVDEWFFNPTAIERRVPEFLRAYQSRSVLKIGAAA